MGQGFQDEDEIRDQPSGRSSSGSASMRMSPFLSFVELSAEAMLQGSSADSERNADRRSSMTAVASESGGCVACCNIIEKMVFPAYKREAYHLRSNTPRQWKERRWKLG